jgi:hypothetical protein
VKLSEITRATDVVCSRTGNTSGLPHRFWSKVDKRGGDECWIWEGSIIKPYGHGHICITRNGKHEFPSAHRVSYLLEHGEVDDDLCVLHHCDNPPCVNPKHLFLGTRTDNFNDCMKKGRWNYSGELNINAKITDNDAMLIIARRKLGERRDFLAAEFGLTPANIYYITSRRTWTHLKF